MFWNHLSRDMNGKGAGCQTMMSALVPWHPGSVKAFAAGSMHDYGNDLLIVGGPQRYLNIIRPWRRDGGGGNFRKVLI